MEAENFSNEDARSVSRRRLLAAAGFGTSALAAVSLVGCGDSSSSSTPKTQGGATGTAQKLVRGWLSYGEGYEGNNLSPNSAVLRPPEVAGVFDALTRIPVSGGLEPSLATSWELDPNDKRTWVFHLRDAEWSDGKPFTAEDVKFTFDYVLDPKNKSALISRVNTVDSVSVYDTHTVKITAKGSGDPLMPKRVYEIFIQPKHYVGDPQYGDAAQATKPIGTGSYVIESYQRGGTIKLKANPNSWRGNKGVEEATIHVLTDDQARLNAFLAGEVDFIDIAPLPSLGQLRQDSSVTVTPRPSNGYNGWDLQYFDGPVKDVRVRQAICHAIDMGQIAKTVMYDVAEVMTQAVTPNCFGYDKSLKFYDYDPDAAKSLLKQAGFPNGFSTTIGYRSNSGVQSLPYANAVQSYLKSVGIKADLLPLDINIWRQYIYGEKPSPPIMQNTWVSGAELDASIALVWFTSDDARHAYNNPQFDKLFTQAIAEFDDHTRENLFHQCLKILNDDPPTDFGVSNAVAQAFHNKKLKDFQDYEYIDTFVLA